MSSAAPGTDRPYFGKYRGVVVSNVDPQRLGRVQVSVPAVLDGTSSWALPCVPLSGNGHGMFLVPSLGASVWVEFEGGDPNYPIWVGGYWSSTAEVPTSGNDPDPDAAGLLFRTESGVTLRVSDAPGAAGGFHVSTPGGATLSVTDDGITISNGKGAVVSLVGPTTDVNVGALTIT